MPEAVIYISFNPAYNSIRYWTRDAAERARLEQETGALATPFFATPALTASHLKVVQDLIELARRVHLALDDSEEQQGPNGRQHALDSQHFDDLCEALDCLEDLPDDKPGMTMGPAGKADWALRQVLVPDGGIEAELRALRKKVATFEARDALGLVPKAPPAAVTASIMRDDGGEVPAFCLMAAYRTEADVQAAGALLGVSISTPQGGA